MVVVSHFASLPLFLPIVSVFSPAATEHLEMQDRDWGQGSGISQSTAKGPPRGSQDHSTPYISDLIS